MPTIPYKNIVQKATEQRDQRNESYPITGAKVGRINKTSFGFDTRKIGGTTELIWDLEIARVACRRFNIPLPNYEEEAQGEGDDVDFVDLSQEKQQQLVDEDPYLEDVADAFGILSTSSTKST